MRDLSPVFQFLIPLLVAALGLSWIFVVKPARDLREVAAETCDELDGAVMLTVGSILSKAKGRADRLGFEPYELGDAMRGRCPGIMRQIEIFAAENGGAK